MEQHGRTYSVPNYELQILDPIQTLFQAINTVYDSLYDNSILEIRPSTENKHAYNQPINKYQWYCELFVIYTKEVKLLARDLQIGGKHRAGFIAFLS